MLHEFSHTWHSKFVEDGYSKMPFLSKNLFYITTVTLISRIWSDYVHSYLIRKRILIDNPFARLPPVENISIQYLISANCQTRDTKLSDQRIRECSLQSHHPNGRLQTQDLSRIQYYLEWT